jgi:hypothetical protein
MLAAEHIYAFHEARDAWEKYLRMGSASGWAISRLFAEKSISEMCLSVKVPKRRAFGSVQQPKSQKLPSNVVGRKTTTARL